MQHRIISTIIAAVLTIAASAQGICTINGNIKDCQLGNGEKIKKVTLTRTNEFGQICEVATAKVKKGHYTFKYELAKDEPTMQYALTGFGEKGITLFIEAGEVSINTAQASHPEKSIVRGTPTNDTYAEYKAIYSNEQHAVETQIAALSETHDEEWFNTTEGKNEVKRIKATEAIKAQTQALRFLIDHNASPMTPLEIEQTMLPTLSAAYAEQITKAMSTTLYQHPYYLSLRNSMLANTLKVGSEAPNITLPLMDGSTTQLNDYRGKYVILHFWESNCTMSDEIMPEMKRVYEVVKDNAQQFLIISVALEDDLNAWKEAVSSHNIQCEHWLHACEGVGKASLAALRYKVDKTPQIIFIEPEGRAVSLDMEVNEIIMRIEQILIGDLYYLDQEK